MELPPVVLQSVGDTYNISAGFQTDWRLCGQQQTALKKQLLLWRALCFTGYFIHCGQNGLCGWSQEKEVPVVVTATRLGGATIVPYFTHHTATVHVTVLGFLQDL